MADIINLGTNVKDATGPLREVILAFQGANKATIDWANSLLNFNKDGEASKVVLKGITEDGKQVAQTFKNVAEGARNAKGELKGVPKFQVDSTSIKSATKDVFELQKQNEKTLTSLIKVAKGRVPKIRSGETTESILKIDPDKVNKEVSDAYFGAFQKVIGIVDRTKLSNKELQEVVSTVFGKGTIDVRRYSGEVAKAITSLQAFKNAVSDVAQGSTAAQRTVANVLEKRQVPQVIRDDPRFAAKVHTYDTNVTTIVNAASRLKLSEKEIAEVLDELAANTGKPFKNTDQQALLSAVKTLDGAYKGLNLSVEKVGLSISKSAQSAHSQLIQDVGKTAIQQGALPTDFSKQLYKTFTDTSAPISGLTNLEKKLSELSGVAKSSGQTFKEFQKSVIDSINQESNAVIEGLNKQNAKEQEIENKRQVRLAARRATAQAETKEIQSRFSGVVSAVSTRPIIGGERLAIPAGASADEVTRLNAAYNILAQTVVKAGISQEHFNNLVADTKKRLGALRASDRLLPPVDKETESVRNAIISVENAYNSVKTAGQKAGNAITISWQGVIRLFQAQVLHTALAQLLADFKTAVFAAGDFQKEIALVQTITQDTNTTFGEWSQTINKLSSELATPSTDVARAAYDALSNQIVETKEQTEAFIRSAGEFGRTTDTTITDSVNLLSSAIHTFGYTAADTEKIAANFFATIDYGRIKGQNLADTFGRTGAFAKALGVSLEENNAALIVLTQQGIKESAALTGLLNVYQKLLRPTEATKELFKELGVVSGEELIALYGVGGALQQITKAAAEGKGDFTDYFNEIRGGAAGFALATDGSRKYLEVVEKLRETTDRYNQAKVIREAPAGVQLQKQITDVKNYITEVGSSVSEFVVNASKKFGTLKDAVATIIDLIKEIATPFVTIVGGIGNVIEKTIGLENALKAVLVVAKSLIIAFAAFYTTINFTKILTGFASMVGGIETFKQAILATQLVAGSLLARLAIFFTNPFTVFAVGAAAAFAVIQHNKEAFKAIGDEAVKSGERTKAALLEAAKVSEEATKKELEATKKILDERTKAYREHIIKVRSSLDELADHQKRVSEQLKNAVTISFAAVTDSIKANIDNLKKAENEALSNAQAAQKAIVDAQTRAQDKQLERAIKYNPQAEVPLTIQRALQLEDQGLKLFDLGNVKEGLELLEKAGNLYEGLADKSADFAVAQRRLNNQQYARLVNQASQQYTQFTASPAHQRLATLAEQYNAVADVSGSEKKRQQLFGQLRQAQQQLTNQATGGRGINTNARQIQLQQLDNQLTQGQYLTQGQINSLLERRTKIYNEVINAQRQSAANSQAEIAAEKAKEREINLQHKAILELTQVRKDSGELLPAGKIEKNLKEARSKADDLGRTLFSLAKQQEDAQKAVGKPVTVDYGKLSHEIQNYKTNLRGLIESSAEEAGIEKTKLEYNSLGKTIEENSKKSTDAVDKIVAKINELTQSITDSGKEVTTFGEAFSKIAGEALPQANKFRPPGFGGLKNIINPEELKSNIEALSKETSSTSPNFAIILRQATSLKDSLSQLYSKNPVGTDRALRESVPKTDLITNYLQNRQKEITAQFAKGGPADYEGLRKESLDIQRQLAAKNITIIDALNILIKANQKGLELQHERSDAQQTLKNAQDVQNNLAVADKGKSYPEGFIDPQLQIQAAKAEQGAIENNVESFKELNIRVQETRSVFQILIDALSSKKSNAQGFATGGLVPAMLTPGEMIFPPGSNIPLLNAINFSPRGTDTIPAFLQPGSYVLNKNSAQYFANGGFVPQIIPTSAISRDTNQQVNTGDIHINMNVQPNGSPQLHGQEIARILQRQLRLGRLK